MFTFVVLDQFYPVIETSTAAITRKPPWLREIYAVITSYMLFKVISPVVHFLAARHVADKLLGCIHIRASHLFRQVSFWHLRVLARAHSRNSIGCDDRCSKFSDTRDKILRPFYTFVTILPLLLACFYGRPFIAIKICDHKSTSLLAKSPCTHIFVWMHESQNSDALLRRVVR